MNNSIQEKQQQIPFGDCSHRECLSEAISRTAGSLTLSVEFMLTSDTPAVRRYFTPGKDLVTAGTKEEMKRVIHYYLNHPAERKAIQHQGQITVRKHMYKHRAQEIIQVLKRKGIITADD
jgi:spore maturation protein CgeB